MLTREHGIADYSRGRLLPDRLTSRAHAHYLGYAERMLEVYRNGSGCCRRDLHRAVQHIFAEEPDCPVRRIDAFCKLLDDVSHYDRDRRGRAAQLRRRVFRAAAEQHPLVHEADRLFEREEHSVKQEIAAALGTTWAMVERDLFADVPDFHRLRAFDGYPDARALLSRYNVAQVQVALFDAVEMVVWVTEDFKTILRYAKLARLLHSIRRTGPGRYVVRLDGPASVLRETRRYGAAMARFVPALVAARGWRMHATLRLRGWTAALDLSSEDGLTSHLPPAEAFDSAVEEKLAAKWGEGPREGWTLVREGEMLYQGQTVFVPDFAFRHEDGREALLEIVGFWTPEYLKAKVETLRTFAEHSILLAVADRVAEDLPDLPPNVIRYKTALKLKDVLQQLGR